MNTTGKAVDSVIQYQLHRDCNGDGGQSECKVKFVKVDVYRDYTITQEDVDNFNDFYGGKLIVGETNTKKVLQITPSEINMNTLYIAYSDERFGIKYSPILSLFHSFSNDFFDGLSNELGEFCSNSINSNYVSFNMLT